MPPTRLISVLHLRLRRRTARRIAETGVFENDATDKATLVVGRMLDHGGDTAASRPTRIPICKGETLRHDFVNLQKRR